MSQAWRQQAERIFKRELSELRCASRCAAEYLDLPATTKSTISVAFSPDTKRFASTHGDHTVKVIDFESGRVAATLVGHPRTPWTVKFHPFLPDVVASGCLGFEARVWDARTSRCVRRAQFDRAIISLSFHPAGDILAVAAGVSIYLWHYADGSPPRREFTHAHPIRCLRFLPSSDAIIVGAANNGAEEGDAPRITFQLMLCAFDATAARYDAGADAGSPTSVRSTASPRGGGGGGGDPMDEEDGAREPPLLVPVAGGERAISRTPRCVLRRALFYNDGGFDVSPCGRFLCSCAELWLNYADQSDRPPPDSPAPALARRDRNAPPSPPRRRLGNRPDAALAAKWPMPSFAPHAATPRAARAPGREALLPWWQTAEADGAPHRQNHPATPTRGGGGDRTPPTGGAAGETPPPPPPDERPRGRFKPHLVVVSLEDRAPNDEGVLLQATALDDHSFSGAAGETAGSDIVTSVKLSPTASLVLLGHSRGGDGTFGDGVPRVVSVMYRVGDMVRVNTRKEVGDDVNIARFHPVSGAGVVYGTKQGRICKITPVAGNSALTPTAERGYDGGDEAPPGTPPPVAP